MLKPLLTANWRYLVMLNYVIKPELLKPFVPSGVELDFHEGETYVSLVGFLFLDTRFLAFAFPFHRDFVELNLRFYVRRRSADTWRRGVTFIREIVPRRAIALVARAFYGERYTALPMNHRIEHSEGKLKIEYSWRRASRTESVSMSASGDPIAVKAGTHEEFITEHYWGYTMLPGGCGEYRVEHPRWKIWPAEHYRVHANVVTLYGRELAETLGAPPVSVFAAEGSHVKIWKREIVA